MSRIVKPPEWATWSLGRAPAEESAGPSGSGMLNGGGGGVPQGGASAKLTSLLRHRDDADVSRSLWHEFGADVRRERVKEEDSVGESEEVRQRIDTILQELEKDETSLQDTYRKFRTHVRVALRPEEPKSWDYLPLTQAESQTLRRCMRLSRYVHYPESDENSARHQRNGSERVTVSPEPEDVVVRAPKKVLKSMLSTFMPTRNFDWIMVNLQHGRANLGLDTEKVRPPQWQRAKDAVRQGTLPPENAAMALYALAQASGMKGLRSVEIGDENGCGGEEQRRENAGVVRALRALFPNFFSDDVKHTSPPSVGKDVLEGHGKLRRAIIEYCVQAEQDRPVREGRRSASDSPASTNSVADTNVKQEEPEQAALSDDSDWADLDYDRGPFQLTHMDENKAFDELTPYEQAMVTYEGKLPYRVDKQLRREAKALKLNEKRKLEGGLEQVEKLRRRCQRFETEIEQERRRREDQERRFARTLQEVERKAEKAYKHDVRALLEAEKEKRRQARLARMGDRVPKKRGRPRKNPLPEEEVKLSVQQCSPEKKGPAVKVGNLSVRSFKPSLNDGESDSSADVDDVCGGL